VCLNCRERKDGRKTKHQQEKERTVHSHVGLKTAWSPATGWMSTKYSLQCRHDLYQWKR
jgi:hypothetical protein